MPSAVPAPEHRLAAEEPFPTCPLYTRVEGLGAAEERGEGLKGVGSFHLRPLASSKPVVQQGEKPGLSACCFWPRLREEQADKGQLLFRLLA